MKFTSKQIEILSVYAQIVKNTGERPSKSDMIANGVTKERIRHHFGGMTQLKKASENESAGQFQVTDIKKEPHKHADFTKEALGSIIKENDYQEGTFFITAVSPVSYLDWSDNDKALAAQDLPIEDARNVFAPAFRAVKNFLNKTSGELILLPMPAHVKALQKQPLYYDPRLKKYINNFATEFTFNKHLKAIEAHLNPQQMNPLTGIKRLKIHRYTDNYQPGQEIKRFKTSLIVAHSKQMMETVATGNESHPRIVHSTGTICNPSYLRNRIGMIANEDHKLGGLIIEIKGDVFWLRQVQFDRHDGSFIDLGKRYHANGTVTEERAEAFKMGDIHPGLHDQSALEATYELWDIIKPKRIFIEDFFDGASISHHTEKKRLTRAKQLEYFKDLPSEIAMARKVLGDVWAKAPKDAEIIATASNHPDHVLQYLDRGAYINDCKSNYDIAHRMVVMELDNKNSLQELLDPDNHMRWTGENEDYYVEGVQMNAHGHLGIGGSRGSKIGHELAYSRAMTAHTHSPSIYHDAYCVGHTSIERHGYNLGPNNWILCNGAVYPRGHMQLYMIVKGSAFKPRS